MRLRTKEEMAAYQQKRRLAAKAVTPEAKPVTPALKEAVTPVTPTLNNVTPVTPDDRDMVIKILRAKVLMLERELGLLKREKKVEREEVPKSPYRLGPGA